MKVFINVYTLLMSELFDIGKKQYRVQNKNYQSAYTVYTVRSAIQDF